MTNSKKTGFRFYDQATGGEKIKELKEKYAQGQEQFHGSDEAKQIRQEADRIRSDNGLNDASYGSGATAKDVYDRSKMLTELGTIKTDYEKKNADNPMFGSTTEGQNARKRANDIRAILGLSDAEYGSNVSGGDVLKKAAAVKQLADTKKKYEDYYAGTPYATTLKNEADSVRSTYGLSDEEYGSDITLRNVSKNLSSLQNSDRYQNDVVHKKYIDTANDLSRQLSRELTSDEKMRAVLDRTKAREIAEESIGAQMDNEIDSRLAYEDELAAQRGSYGQPSYGKRKALMEDRLRDNRAKRVSDLVESLINEDRANAQEEYRDNVNAKERKIAAIQEQMRQNNDAFSFMQNYRNSLSQEEAAQQQALYNQVKATYDRAYEMSNSLGYVTPELSEITGIPAGTPLFKMIEYYGDMDKFYAELELDAQRVAIEQYNALKPRYSYNGYQNNYRKTSEEPTLSWNQAKAAYEAFSSAFSEQNGMQKPGIQDTMRWLESSGYGPHNQEQILLAAGVTPSNIASYHAAYQNPRDDEMRMLN